MRVQNTNLLKTQRASTSNHKYKRIISDKNISNY